MKTMRWCGLHLAAAVWALALAGSSSSAQEAAIRYGIRFSGADHHEAEVTVRFPAVEAGTLEMRMSRSSPGRYAIHEFAKNVYGVRASDAKGNPLELTRPNPYQWDVRHDGGTVELHYTIFGDRCDGTYLAVDNTHAHMNIPATFMWARGLEHRPIELHVHPKRSDWKVATQLEPTEDPNVFRAPNLYYFLDSPTEVSAFDLHEWQVSRGGREATMRFALHHQGTKEQAERYVQMVKGVVREAIAIYGELPRFDYGTYTFIADYLPYASGDGMEHRNSTILTSTATLATPDRPIGTVAHEFFHAWNVERIRPSSLEPFDFERANMSGELWFAEGFTSYYDDLILKRAELIGLKRYANALSSPVNTVVNATGRAYFSPVEMSQQAPFVDAATSVDPTNRANTFVSYYTYGSVLALSLDLTLRTKFSGLSLDDFMRAAWKAHGDTEISYEVADLQRILGDVTGDESFARDFFASSIQGARLPDLKALLARAGFLVRPRDAAAVWVGADVGAGVNGRTVSVDSRVLRGSGFYDAGLGMDDVLVELAGEKIDSLADFARALDKCRVGDEIEIVFEKRGETRRARVVLKPDPSLEVVLYEDAGLEVTESMARLRAAWLESPPRARHQP